MDNNDKTESFAFTEVGQTFAGGLGANGAWWHRRYDRAGLALASNAISKDHQTYLADGGYGFLLGDGALNYGRENIVETYYTAHVWRGIYLAPGLQYIINPGYNPVTVDRYSCPPSARTWSSSGIRPAMDFNVGGCCGRIVRHPSF